MNTTELQLMIEREKWDRFHAAQAAGKADNPRLRRLAKTWAALQAAGKVRETTSHVPTTSEDGPVMRKAKAWAEELRQARAGEAARQANGVGVAEATHKLPPHIVYG